MKKVLILLAFFVVSCYGGLYSQMALPIAIDNVNNSNFDELISECIEPLDKSLITSGILGERGFLFTEMEGWMDSVITMPQWRQLYRQLFLGSVSQVTIISPDSIRRMSNRLLRQDIIPIVMMNLDYNQIKPYALDSNLLMLSGGKLYDVPNRKESPYVDKHVFAATVLKERVYRGQVTFRLDERFFITNASSRITSIEIDFDDGRGFRGFLQNGFSNQDITINYQEPGEKVLTVRVGTSNQTVFQSKSKFIVAANTRRTPNATFTVDGCSPYNDTIGSGTAYIIYGCDNKQLRKPIIVSDGFDPAGTNDFDSICSMLEREDFLEKALSEGFDFVILDYENGADYIQRNAMVMVSLINEVNDRLERGGSNSQLVVLGPSMGGLITRYALSYMEQKGMSHNTGLYVSFDSPHFGANIPLGDQCFIKYATRFPAVNDSILNIINSPAARQMLVYHHESEETSGGHDPLRDDLLSDPYFSFPIQCRKIAIANGSGKGKTCLEPGVHMLSLDLIVLGADVWAIAGADEVVFNSWPFGHTKIVSGAKPYDGAPGGQRDVNNVIKSEAPWAFWALDPVDPICFIPVISSLAINTDNVNYRVHDIPGYPYPSSYYTPFDAIYAPEENEYHVEVTNDNIEWIMNEIGAFDMFLQNRTLNKATDFEARNTITTGRNVVSYIPEGNFVMQNGEGESLLHCECTIRFKDGTRLKPWGTGVVRAYTSKYPCESMFEMPKVLPRGNSDGGETAFEHQAITEVHESIAQTSAEKLPRNHPNPCNDYTTVEYELEANAKVEIDVYNLVGMKMLTVEDHHNQGAGRYFTTINTSSLPAGMYIGVVRANGKTNGMLKIQVMR